MTMFSLPAEGLELEHISPDRKQPSQIVRLDVESKDLEGFLKHVQDGGISRFKTGRFPEVIFGNTHISLRHVIADKFVQELYSAQHDGGRAYFSGRLSHTLEVKQAKEAISAVDDAFTLLKHNLKQAKDERNQADINPISSKLFKPQHRPSPLGAGLLGSRPSSPFLTAGFSPRSGPTSAPLVPTQSKEEKTKLAAIKIPVIHLLAIEPREAKELVKVLGVKKSDLDLILAKVAQEGEGGKKKLRDRAYRDLDVWKFPYHLQHDRQAAIDRAISAFDRLRIDSSDKLWQMLLAKEDRDKGIKLSRLNFDKPLLTGNLTPRLPERSTDGGSTEGKSTKSATSDPANKMSKLTVTKRAEPTQKPKPIVEKSSRSAKELNHKAALPVKFSNNNNNGRDISSAKKEVKYKSSEKVENSDEEIEIDHPRTTTGRKSVSSKDSKPTLSARSPVVASNSTSRRHQVSDIRSSGNDRNRGRPTPTPAMVMTRGGKDTKPQSNPVPSATASKYLPPSQSRNLSRPRQGSSPSKPSPLGFSPPNKVLDNDSSSTSSKGTTLSSAPSTPPSGSENSQANKTAHSVAKHEKKTERLTNGIKRKADSASNAPPAKKQHLASGKNGTDQLDSLPRALKVEIAHNTTSKRATSDFDTSNGTDRSVSKESLVGQAKNFQKYYTRYRLLHEKLNSLEPDERQDDEIDNVWKMHQRLKEMKSQIWRDWNRLEAEETVKS